MAARRAYVASTAAADNKAAASAARRACVTRAARRTVKADVSAKRRAYAANPLPPPTTKQRPPPQIARTWRAPQGARMARSSEDGDVEAGAYDEGSDGDDAAVSAARCAHAASGTADDPKAIYFL